MAETTVGGTKSGRISTVAENVANEPKDKEAQGEAIIGPAQMTLPHLMSDILGRVMKDKTHLQQAKRDLYIWYNAQPVEGRQELVKTTRKDMESARLICEALYMSFVEISQRDA